ncbi:MAG: hypothetical protein IPL78_30030 [Chloroflexi bacterium]|nr:hypothetical protein [Chloroflexota bacterium]
MKLSRLLSLTTTLAGAAAASRVLLRRQQWEQQHNRVALCVDFDDAAAAAIRAALSFDEMLHKLAENGATHVSLPEWTLARLLHTGELTSQAPARPRTTAPRVGHWNYVHGHPELVTALAQELQIRLPYTQAEVISQHTLVFAGDLPTIGELGLGFDPALAERIRARGLGLVPRPVSYAWPEKALLERTLAQAAQLGPYVAFEGNMILGHEMHLDETLEAMTQAGLSLVYFAESRHQKGDWFIAKRRAPNVVLGHRFTPDEMIPLDYHAAVHNWVHLAQERGIRFCYINFFRILHATEPLEGLHYVHHLKHAFEDAGFVVDQQVDLPTPVPAPDTLELAAAGLAVAGLGAAALTDLLDLPESLALPLAAMAAGGAAALPFLEQARNQAAQAQAHHHDHDHHHDHEHEHEHDHEHHDHDHGHDHGDLAVLYPPSYAPKLLGLGAAALSPVASLLAARQGEVGWLAGVVYQAAGATALATVTSGPEYQLRIEEYKGFNLDWLVPLAAAAWQIPQPGWRAGALAGLGGAWLLTRQRGVDVLAQVDPGHAQGHTHHISAAMAMVGDVMMTIGPKPARKWAGLGPAAQAASVVLAQHGQKNGAVAAAAIGVLGNMLGLVGFRRPERGLMITARESGRSWLVGAG